MIIWRVWQEKERMAFIKFLGGGEEVGPFNLLAP